MQCALGSFLIRKVDSVNSIDPSKISEWIGQTFGAWRESVVIHGGRTPRRSRIHVSQWRTGNAFANGNASRAKTSSRVAADS